MKLSDAFKIINKARFIETEQSYNLICGFSPLHLQTYIQANLQKVDYAKKININTGTYGDVFSSLSDAQKTNPTMVALEWSDFDARLGWRAMAIWVNESQEDILSCFNDRIKKFAADLDRFSLKTKVIVSLPLLPLPPIGSNSYLEVNIFQLRLKSFLYEFCEKIIENPNIRILNEDTLKIENNCLEWDFKSLLKTGYPYTLNTTARLASHLADLIIDRPPIKGLITDLDNTCWRGIIGDDGIDGISWTQEHGAHEYSLYQTLLNSLASNGTLVAIASKNSKDIVDEALENPSMVLNRNQIHPIEANWGSKSASIQRILSIWNISDTDILFVDDNPLELAEVTQHFPNINTVLFPTGKPNKIKDLIVELRNRCGKSTITEEDMFRSESIKNAPDIVNYLNSGHNKNDFISTLDANITFSLLDEYRNDRAFELVNKTNQFNLNGRRYTSNEWSLLNHQIDRFLLSVEYQDKFGKLGRISIVTGSLDHNCIIIDTWVLSCRAFSRQIEHGIIKEIFSNFKVDQVSFRYVATEKNEPTRLFFEKFKTSKESGEYLTIKLKDFNNNCPILYHKIRK